MTKPNAATEDSAVQEKNNQSAERKFKQIAVELSGKSRGKMEEEEEKEKADIEKALRKGRLESAASGKPDRKGGE